MSTFPDMEVVGSKTCLRGVFSFLRRLQAWKGLQKLASLTGDLSYWLNTWSSAGDFGWCTITRATRENHDTAQNQTHATDKYFHFKSLLPSSLVASYRNKIMKLLFCTD